MDVRWVAYLGSGLLAVASLVPLAVPRPPADDESAEATRRRAPIDTAPMVDVERHTARLREYATAAPAPRTPSRNPFRFSPRRAAPVHLDAAPAGHAPAGVAPTVEPPAPPVLRLIGLASRRDGEATAHTAIVSGLGDVFLVAAGDRIANRFTVVAVGPDAVEIREDATQETLRLGLR